MDWGVRYLTLTPKKSGGKEKLTLEGICDVTLEGFYCRIRAYTVKI